MPTQTERREVTRTALLEAAVLALAEHGYAGTTTARIAELAGVSRGAAPHYFAGKADLLAQALAYLAQRRIDGIREAVPPSAVDRDEAILDLIWDAHQGRLFAATVELWVAARDDEELRGALLSADHEVRAAIWDAFIDIAGPRSQEPGFRADMELVLATVRGLALLSIMGAEPDDVVERRWSDARRRLLTALTTARETAPQVTA